MTRKVIVIPPELPLEDAWNIMTQLRIRHLPIVRNEALLGIVSDRDVLVRSRLESGEVVPGPGPVGEAMSPAPFVCTPQTNVAEIVRTMTERKLDAMPVMGHGDKLVGLVTSTDLLLLLIEQDEARPLPFDFEIEEHGLTATA